MSSNEEFRRAFQKFLMDLADEIPRKDLAKLKGLMKGKAGYGAAVLDEIQEVSQFFRRLEEKGDLTSENTEYLKQLLRDIHREDLCTLVDAFENSCQEEHQQGKLNLR